MPSFTTAATILRDSIPSVAPAAQLVVNWRGEIVHAQAVGVLDPETDPTPVTAESRFDLASVTKLFVTATFMRLVEDGAVSLDTPVSHAVPDFSGVRPIKPYEDPLQSGEFITVAEGGQVDAGAITYRQLLTHTSGLPAWRPLFREPSGDEARTMALQTYFSYAPGTRIIYSDIGLILLGMAVEQLTRLPLETAVSRAVSEPLALRNTGYRPTTGANVVPTEVCAWRGHRVRAEVHDENAARLGGVSGHAGLFSTAADTARFGQSFLNGSLLRAETVAEMSREQARDGDLHRGLGFLLWSPDPEASSHPFSQRAYGHTGFTGTSLWIDPDRDLVVALLTNRVYHGRAVVGIMRLRVDVHRAIVAALS